MIPIAAAARWTAAADAAAPVANANAALIVRAVNAHQGLISTLQSLEARMKDSDPEGTCKKVVDAWLSDVREAISRAEEGK